MTFCPVVPEICRGQVHGAQKERRITRTRRIIIIIIIRNGAKIISLQTLFGRLNYRWSQCRGKYSHYITLRNLLLLKIKTWIFFNQIWNAFTLLFN